MIIRLFRGLVQICLLMYCCFVTQVAHAIDKDWAAAADGFYNGAGNWSPVGVPVAGDRVLFRQSGSYRVLVFGDYTAAEMQVISGDVGFDFLDTNIGNSVVTLAGGSPSATRLLVGTGPSSNATLRIQNTDNLRNFLDVQGAVVIGRDALSTGGIVVGSNVVGDSELESTGDLVVGQSGSGALSIVNGTVTTGDDLIVAQNSGSAGNITVGSSEKLNIGDDAFIGGGEVAGGGLGLMTIDNGVVTIADRLHLYAGGGINLLDGSLSVGRVTGASELQYTRGNLSITQDGLTIDPASVFTNSNISVDDGVWHIAEELIVGDAGSASLNYAPEIGFSLQELSVGADLVIGRQSGSSGTLQVQAGVNAGFEALVSGNAYVGGSALGTGGAGNLIIEDGKFQAEQNLTVWSTGQATFSGGESTVAGQVFLSGPLAVTGGTFTAGDIFGTPAQLSWTGGELEVGGFGVQVDSMSVFGSTLQIGTGMLLTTTELRTGISGNGTIEANGGATIVSVSGQLGDAGPGQSTFSLSDSGTTWTMSGDLSVGGNTVSELNISNGATVSNSDAFIAANNGRFAVVSIIGTGTQWNSNSISLGEVDSGVGDQLAAAALNVDGGTVTASVDVVIGDSSNATLINNGRIVTPTLVLHGNLNAFGRSLDLGGSGDIGVLSLSGGTLTADLADFKDVGFTGFGTIVGRVKSDGPVVASGTLTLGESGTIGAVDIRGSLQVGGNSVTVHQRDRYELPADTQISGGSLIVPNGAYVQSGVLLASGSVAGPFVIASSGIVQANGLLSLGEATAVNGFASAGTLIVGNSTVTLLDANDAVFDSLALVILGEGGESGTLTATNGISLDLGGNFQGYGTIDTPNNAATPLINNGNITGDSLSNPITLRGYVQGVGTCDNCVITGTDAPGFSPAMVNRGSVRYEGTLEMELGGLTAGSEFDQLNHILGAGVAQLGGALDVQLINGFQPALGDSFEIITASGGVSGGFEGITSGFDVIYSTNSVHLVSVSALSGDYNNDGKVDLADYTVWRNNLGAAADTLLNDMVGGVIDADQYTAWKNNFGATILPTASLANATVPEPSTCVLLTMFALVLAHFYRRI